MGFGEVTESEDIPENTKEGKEKFDSAALEKFDSLMEDDELPESETDDIADSWEDGDKLFDDMFADDFEDDDGLSDEADDLSDEANEAEELTDEEINEKQQAAIKEGLEKIKNGENLTNEELGNLGEMMMDQYYISKGYTPLNKNRVTSLDDRKGGFKTGIDGVYEKTDSDGSESYVIADAKYNTSQLSDTNDGKQMSDNWIDKRLDDAVGKEKADEIRDAAEDDPDSVAHEVYHIDPNEDENGNIHTDTQEVDSEGNKIGEKTIVEYFDGTGNRIDTSEEE